ncbi:MAG: hypothetical protein ACK5R0_03805, partial [Bacteroidota bacterium]
MGNTAVDIDLNKEIVSSFSAQDFSGAIDSREIALMHFQKLGLPTNKSEEYRFTPIGKNLAKNFTWKTASTESTIGSVEPFL